MAGLQLDGPPTPVHQAVATKITGVLTLGWGPLEPCDQPRKRKKS